jgi:hypothetical protein
MWEIASDEIERVRQPGEQVVALEVFEDRHQRDARSDSDDEPTAVEPPRDVLARQDEALGEELARDPGGQQPEPDAVDLLFPAGEPQEFTEEEIRAIRRVEEDARALPGRKSRSD